MLASAGCYGAIPALSSVAPDRIGSRLLQRGYRKRWKSQDRAIELIEHDGGLDPSVLQSWSFACILVNGFSPRHQMTSVDASFISARLRSSVARADRSSPARTRTICLSL
jgi:hypothetical protein